MSGSMAQTLRFGKRLRAKILAFGAYLADLARIFADLVHIAGEPLARGFVGRLEGACLKLSTFPSVAVSAPGYDRVCASSATADRRVSPLW
jgi:hypothetical protein